MDDNRPGRPGDEDDNFNDALDDLFGEPVEPNRPTPPGAGYVPPPPNPQPHHDAQWTSPPPAQQGTTFGSVTRFAVIGCVAIFALGVVCVIALAMIGLIFGDPDATTSGVLLPVL